MVSYSSSTDVSTSELNGEEFWPTALAPSAVNAVAQRVLVVLHAAEPAAVLAPRSRHLSPLQSPSRSALAALEGGMRVQSWRSIRLVGAFLIAACLLWPGAAEARRAPDAASLNRQITEQQNSGNYAEAILLAQRLVALMKARHGQVSVEHADALERLAETYFGQSKYAEAEPVYVQVVAIRTKVLGAHDERVLSTIVTLADLYRQSGHPQMGEPLLQKALEARIEAVGRNHASLADALRALADIELVLERYSEAEEHVSRAIDLSIKAKKDPLQIAQLFGTQSQIARRQGQLGRAEDFLKKALALHEKVRRSDPNSQLLHAFTMLQLVQLYQQSERDQDATVLAERALKISEQAVGPDHPVVASLLETVATLYEGRGRSDEGDALRKRALIINERAFGTDSIQFAQSLKGLGVAYGLQGRNEDGLPLVLRALEIAEKVLGSDNPALFPYLSDVGARYLKEMRFEEAEHYLLRALAGLEKSPNFDPFLYGVQLTGILQSLANIYQSQGRYPEARAFLDRALPIAERAFGPDHSQTGGVLVSLAMLHLQQDQTDEALRLFERALPITVNAGKDDLSYANNIAGIGMVHFQREEWAKAYAAIKDASSIYVTVSQRAAAGGATRANSGSRGQAIQPDQAYLVQAFIAYYLAEGDEAAAETLRDEAFQMVQRAESSRTAAALGQMAARFSSGEGTLATLVRERQDLGVEWQALDTRLAEALAAPSAQRNRDGELVLRQRLSTIAGRLDGLNARFAKELPEYTALTNPQPLSIADVQRLLLAGEALLLIASHTHESLIWVVSTDRVQWMRVPLGEQEIAGEVAALRCGLDDSLWDVAESYDKCAETIKKYRYDANFDGQFVRILPFDLNRAHELYKALLAPFEGMIADKHLLFVPSRSLMSLPLGVLVTEPPNARIPVNPTGYREVSWLGVRQPLSVLPSVGSLKMLRQFAKPARATKTYLGIGNPVLEGPQRGQWRAFFKQQADVARSKSCLSPPTAEQQLASLPVRRSVENFKDMFRGFAIDIEQVRQQTPLPGTADELCEVGRRLGVPVSDIILGPNATEGTLKRLSDDGRLADYGIVHFATHGALTGQLTGWSEPGLILTPPAEGTTDPKQLQRDDGYVTASEIATLKFDADWVVLSACYTGGGSGESAEALSGLARAFFYAGTRTLLISHWDVDSDAAVALTTRAFAELTSNHDIGRAEALRISMRELLEKGKPYQVQPSEWAPFAIVGEGAKRR
jgi:CHAT domain-containing protein/tetratricopeptide (TPR) repeat protein